MNLTGCVTAICVAIALTACGEGTPAPSDPSPADTFDAATPTPEPTEAVLGPIDLTLHYTSRPHVGGAIRNDDKPDSPCAMRTAEALGISDRGEVVVRDESGTTLDFADVTYGRTSDLELKKNGDLIYMVCTFETSVTIDAAPSLLEFEFTWDDGEQEPFTIRVRPSEVQDGELELEYEP